MPYTVKAFNKFSEVVETYESHNQAEERYEELKYDNESVYVYDPNNDLIKAYAFDYLDYLEKPSCVYCGSQSCDGYCWQSPDGNHVPCD